MQTVRQGCCDELITVQYTLDYYHMGWRPIGRATGSMVCCGRAGLGRWSPKRLVPPMTHGIWPTIDPSESWCWVQHSTAQYSAVQQCYSKHCDVMASKTSPSHQMARPVTKHWCRSRPRAEMIPIVSARISSWLAAHSMAIKISERNATLTPYFTEVIVQHTATSPVEESSSTERMPDGHKRLARTRCHCLSAILRFLVQ